MTSTLTKKEKGFVKDILLSGNATKAALNNYDIESKNKENVAGAIGSENLRKPKIRKALEPFLIRYQHELDEILNAMALKDKKDEQYRTLVEAANVVQKQIQLLSGGSTENVAVQGVEITVRK